MIDSIDRQAVLEAIQEWIDTGEYAYTNATFYLLKRIGEIPTDWIDANRTLPTATNGYEPCILVNVIGKDGVSGTGYYNELSGKWYLLLNLPECGFFLNERDTDYVDRWKPIPR